MIAGSPIAILTTLPEDLQAKIRSAFAKLNVDDLTASGRCDGSECLLPDGYEWGYVEYDDGQFEGIRQVCETTQAEACE